MSRPAWAGLSWSPQRLGRSLPVHRPLWLSRAAAAGLTLLAGLLALSQACDVPGPGAALASGEAEQLVLGRLARTQVPPWVPGPPLPEKPPPDLLASPPPPLWPGPHPRDRRLAGEAARLAVRAREDLAAGDPRSAATRFLRAAEKQPTWEALMGAGLSLLEAGDPSRALPELERADGRLNELEAAGAGGPAHYAARIATRHAAGLAALAARDCIRAIQHQRRAVRYLRRYVEVEGALVYDRKLPFRVREAGIDNHSVWTTLARAYAECEGRFPDDYPAKHGEQDFRSEYRTAGLEEIEQGPFPQGLAACVAAGPRPRSTCWAYSNLNKVAWASRSFLPEDGGTASGRLDGLLVESLARFAFEVAWLGAASEHEEDRRRAGRFLGFAARLDRRARVPGLEQRIAGLGRHLAPLTGDYSALAEPWRRTDLAAVTLEADLGAEDLKGIAWALSERWLDLLAGRRPGRMIEQVEAQIRRAGPFGEELQGWKARAQKAMQKALAEEIRLHSGNDNPRAALAIRDFRADWLGEGWPGRARRAWASPQRIAGWAGLGLLWAAFSAAVWLIHGLVVFPYLVYTTDAYRLEHRRRHARRKAEGKAFVRDEIERYASLSSSQSSGQKASTRGSRSSAASSVACSLPPWASR